VKERFTSLPEAKGQRLIEESIREFAEHGYAGASTNRIVARVGIAKGSLFHYFGTKNRLYLALLDTAAEEIKNAVGAAAEQLPLDPVKRILLLARAEFSFYTAQPDLYLLFRRAVSDPDTAEMVRDRYKEEGMAIFEESLGGADFAENIDKTAAVDVLAWVVNGFNEAFLPTTKSSDDPVEVMRRYEKELIRYLSVIAPCLRKSTETTNTGGTT
jgi:AcrR family transcriptional regulator